GQRREAHHVARSINMFDRGLEMVIDGELAAIAHSNACRTKVQLIAIGLAAYAVKQRLPMHIFAALEFGEYTIALRIDANGNYLLAQTKDRAELTQLKAEVLNNLSVDKIQQHRSLIEQSDLGAQSGKHGSIFQTDNAGAHHDEFPGNLFQAMHLIGIEDTFSVH